MFFCKKALLRCRRLFTLVVKCSEAAEESVYDRTAVKQIFQGTERCRGMGGESVRRWGRRGEVRPVRRNQRFAAIGQDQNQMQSTFAMRGCENVERSALKRMASTDNPDFLGKVLMMGSVAISFDTIRHSVLVDRIAERVQDPQVLHLVKQIIKAGGKIGVPQGGPFSPLAANIYLNEVDWGFDAIRRKTAQGSYEAVNYHRFADDVVITVDGHHSKRGWAERALQRLQEQLAPLGVELNQEKTKVVDMLKGEAFGFLGFDLRRVRKSRKGGYFIRMTPKKKARKAVKAKICETIRRGGSTSAKMLISQINVVLTGWVNYFRVGHSSRTFSEVREYLEMKVRTLLTRRTRRRKSSVGWRRWSNEYLMGFWGCTGTGLSSLYREPRTS
ncbi:MAG: reverse transcriptase domain-containing protein [Candidatus Acidiferrales bacterium]